MDASFPDRLVNLEAEAVILSMLLMDNRRLEVVGDIITADDFAIPMYGRIYAKVAAMIGAGESATPVTLYPHFVGDPELEPHGGVMMLAQLTGSMTSLIMRPRAAALHLKEMSRRRSLWLAGQRLSEMAADDHDRPIASLIDEAEGAMNVALEGTVSRPALGFASAWDHAIRKVRAVGAGTEERGARVAELVEWNEITGGMLPGQLILLGGRPGMGKTAVALAVARRTAEAGHGVLFISREMPVDQLMMRIVADMLFEAGSAATFDDVLNGRLSPRDYEVAEAIRKRIDDWPLAFEEPDQLNASRVASLVRKHQRQMAAKGHKLAVAVVDYLGLLDPPQRRSNREQEMGDTSREMKAAARSTGVAILALAQLNRGVEQRDDKRPLLSDLRDSGSLEQDADTVVFAYRAEYYLRQAEPDVSDIKKRDAWEVEMGAERDRLDIYSAKVRQGEPQRRKVYFFGSRQAVRAADYYRSGGGWGPQ